MADTLSRMLHSIVGQSYENWKLIITDDVSDPDQYEALKETVSKFRTLMGSSTKIETFFNDTKRWEVENVLRAIKECDDDDIICRIDCDDWLTDADALSIIDHAYKSYAVVDAMWTKHRWGFSDRNISNDMSQGADPYVHPWVSSHLKTFRKKLLNGIPVENFKNQAGQFVRRAGDQAIYLPALKRANMWCFIPRVMYHYSIDERGGEVYTTDDAKFQRGEAEFLRERGYVNEGEPWEKFV
jgi:glycosyltransferase involved in cell wall biosynthesis